MTLRHGPRLRALLAFVVLLALAAPAAAKAQTATLEGEFLISTMNFEPNTFEFTTNCDNPDGTASTSVRATGFALGPYPGTFEETVTITLSAAAPDGSREILDIEASFRIDSGEIEITGTKRLSSELFSQPSAMCVSSETEGRPVCTSSEFQASGFVRYDATIDGPDGSSSDSGIAEVRVVTLESRGCLDIGDRAQGQLTENFLVSSRLASTPGQATGGGEVATVDGTGSVSFGFTARADEDGKVQGACSLLDHASGVHVTCLDVATYVQLGNQAFFSGRARVDGVETTYRAEVADNGQSGAGQDVFVFQTDSGFAAGGVLTAGNIYVHSP